MARTFHCSLDTLRNICETKPKWRLTALQTFSSLNVRVNKAISLPTEEDYVRMTSGDIPTPNKHDDEFLAIDSLQRMFSLPRISTYMNMNGFDWEKHSCDVVTKDAFLDPKAIPIGISTVSSQDFLQLIRSWQDEPNKNDQFCWGDFFSRTLPTSNSMIINDRYMFKNISVGAMNVADIMFKTIPDNFTGEYRLLLVFDNTQGKCTNIMGKVSKIDLKIRNSFKNKKCRLRVEYLLVWDSDKERGRWCDPIQHDLYLETHDRWLLSNYYKVTASHAMAASKVDGFGTSKIATESQELKFRTIFDGINNSDQKPEQLPIIVHKKKLQKFLDLLDVVSEDKVICLCTTSENPVPRLIRKSEFKNRIVINTLT